MQYFSYRLKIGATNKKFIEIEAGGAQLKGNSHPMFLRSCLISSSSSFHSAWLWSQTCVVVSQNASYLYLVRSSSTAADKHVRFED